MQTKSLDPALDHLGLRMSDLPDLVNLIPMNTVNMDDLHISQKAEK